MDAFMCIMTLVAIALAPIAWHVNEIQDAWNAYLRRDKDA